MAMNPRLAAALRFGLTVAVVNLAALGLFGAGAAATAASFASIAALYFLDYDGSTRERLSAFGLSTVVGLAGVLLGAAVAGALLAVAVSAFVVGFGFTVARAYRGLVARSFVGAQLAFVLAVFTEHARAELPLLLGGWLFGSAIAIAAALVLFPRRHTGLLRAALSRWCLAAAELLRAEPSAQAAALASLRERFDELTALDRGESIAGLWSNRTRALAGMRLQIGQLNTALDSIVLTATQSELAEASAEGFERAAQLVRAGATAQPLVSVDTARERDLAAQAEHYAATASSNLERARADVAEQFGTRVLSIGAESLQVLASTSQGWPHPDWALALEPEHTVASLGRRALRADSVWRYAGLRTGLALAGAATIAMLLGLEHGVWVVMAALAVINVSVTSRGASRTAAQTVIGVLGGVLIAGLLITVLPDWWMLAVTVPLLAGLAKWLLPAGPLLAQLSYSPFAVLNVAMLSWPSPHGLTVVRFEDISIGAAVALIATVLTFPFGMRRLLERSWQHAQTAAHSALLATQQFLQGGPVVPPALRQAQAQSFAANSDTVDTVYAGGVQLHDFGRLTLNRQRWLALALLAQAGLDQLAEQQLGFTTNDPRRAVIAIWADSSETVLREHAPA
ncbi:MAG: FUSC family protein [Microbacteriaceae bacterium]